MVGSTHSEEPTVTSEELQELVRRAEKERWKKLAIVRFGPLPSGTNGGQWHAFRVTDAIGPDGAQLIASLDALTHLDLRNNSIGDHGTRSLAKLENLQYLSLPGNEIGDTGTQTFESLQNLQCLNLRGNEIGSEGARGLGDIQGLSSLDLGWNHIGDDGARTLSKLTNLTKLDLLRNEIGCPGARMLAELTNLTSLQLAGNSIGDDGARALGSLTRLESLNLSSNRIGDAGVLALKGLMNLQSLGLDENHIGDEGVVAFADLPALKRLGLARNAIRDSGASVLMSLPNVEVTFTNEDIVDEIRRMFLDGATPSYLMQHISSRHNRTPRLQTVINDYFEIAFQLMPHRSLRPPTGEDYAPHTRHAHMNQMAVTEMVAAISDWNSDDLADTWLDGLSVHSIDWHHETVTQRETAQINHLWDCVKVLAMLAEQLQQKLDRLENQADND